MAKSAVHHLVKNIKEGLPKGSKAVGALPVILDTMANRMNMPDIDPAKMIPADDLS